MRRISVNFLSHTVINSADSGNSLTAYQFLVFGSPWGPRTYRQNNRRVMRIAFCYIVWWHLIARAVSCPWQPQNPKRDVRFPRIFLLCLLLRVAWTSKERLPVITADREMNEWKYVVNTLEEYRRMPRSMPRSINNVCVACSAETKAAVAIELVASCSTIPSSTIQAGKDPFLAFSVFILMGGGKRARQLTSNAHAVPFPRLTGLHSIFGFIHSAVD